jgi:hypothetical protein
MQVSSILFEYEDEHNTRQLMDYQRRVHVNTRKGAISAKHDGKWRHVISKTLRFTIDQDEPPRTANNVSVASLWDSKETAMTLFVLFV